MEWRLEAGLSDVSGVAGSGVSVSLLKFFFENFQGSLLISGHASARDYAGWSYILIGQVEGVLDKGGEDLMG